MIRKIANIYEYYDYQQVIHDDFLIRTTHNHSYSFRAYCRDLKVSAGFLTEVLNGKKELSEHYGKKVFSALGFQEKDLLYCINLVLAKSKINRSNQQEAQTYVDQHYQHVGYIHDPKLEKIIESVEHFLAYGISRVFSEIAVIKKVFKELGLSEKSVLTTLKDLNEHNLVTIKDNHVFVVNQDAKLTNSKELPKLIRKFSDHILNRIVENGIDFPNRVAQASILTFDDRTYSEAVQAHKFFIKKLNRLAKANTKSTVFVFLSSAFLTVPVPIPESEPNPSAPKKKR